MYAKTTDGKLVFRTTNKAQEKLHYEYIGALLDEVADFCDQHGLTYEHEGDDADGVAYYDIRDVAEKIRNW